MQMKKKILMLVMAISMVCLVGCKKDEVTPSVPNVPNNNGTTVVDSGDVITNESDISGDEIYSGDIEEIINAYNEVEKILPEEIKDYNPAFNAIYRYANATEEISIEELGVSTLLKKLKNSADPFAKLSYALKDVNGDGVNEMLIYDNSMEEKNVIVSMYTLLGEEKECYHILNSQTNYLFKLCENNVIKAEYTDVEDTGETFIAYHKLDKENNLQSIEVESGDSANYPEVSIEKKPIK